MSIATEITRIKNNIEIAYSAAEAKGATIPTDKNSANLATTIDSITVGGGDSKYGASVNNFLFDVDENGKIERPTIGNIEPVFSGVRDVGDYALCYKFINSREVISVSFPDLISISGNYACTQMFFSCFNLTSVSFPNLTSISNGCGGMFSSCNSLTSVSFPNLTSISGTASCSSMFSFCYNLQNISIPELSIINGQSSCIGFLQSCISLNSISFPKLSVINGNSACGSMFSGCTNLSDVYFNSLKTSSFGSYKNQFSNLLNATGTTTTHTLHFPSNMESTISTLTGYPLFGGTSGYVVLAFDLPATE